MLEEQVGRFIFATYSSFTVAEHPEFRKLVGMLEPKAKLPGRRALSGRILTQVFEKEWAKFTASVDGVSHVSLFLNPQLVGKHVTLAIDGWSNLTNQPFLAILLDNELFYTLDTTGVLPSVLGVVSHFHFHPSLRLPTYG